MANTLPINTSSVFAGLGTGTATITVAGPYTVFFQSSIPYIASGSSSNSAATAPSALQVVINQDTGGGPVAKLTVNTPGATQPMISGSVHLSCAVGDVITVVLTSSNAADNALNAIKTTINVYQGE